jgi:hypothetical protein
VWCKVIIHKVIICGYSVHNFVDNYLDCLWDLLAMIVTGDFPKIIKLSKVRTCFSDIACKASEIFQHMLGRPIYFQQ